MGQNDSVGAVFSGEISVRGRTGLERGGESRSGFHLIRRL